MKNILKITAFSLLALHLATNSIWAADKKKTKPAKQTKPPLTKQAHSTATAKKVQTPAMQPVKIAYLSQEQQPPAVFLSNLDPFIPNQGLAGAKLAIEDNNTTGQFIHQNYSLTEVIVPLKADIVQEFLHKVSADTAFVLVNLPSAQINKLADLPQTRQKLIFDVASNDDALRNEQCRANVLHIQPNRAMRADALAQYMMKKRWNKWFLIIGANPEDKLYADAIKRSAKRFGMKIVAEKAWTHTFDARKSEQSEVPVFTQGADYDVLVVADEQGLFGEYLDYRTWLPRPVVGTQGLVASAWHRVHEQWGAVQIQNRFFDMAHRAMGEQDYGAYLAVRAIGEAAVRTQSNQMQPVKDYLLGAQFTLQGYKGNPLSFRSWDGQLRQPVLLASARSLVAVAPIEGFLHPKTELDTLGFDQPESGCKAKFLAK